MTLSPFPPRLPRRRFLTIAAGAAALGLVGMGRGQAAEMPLSRWSGVALGAEAQIILAHPDADRLLAEARAELARLEGIFSLYRTDSALARLNAQGQLDAPPQEMVELLALAGLVHDATDGLFDPTIQPLWAAHARSFAAGGPPDPATIAAARALTGWEGVTVEPGRIALARPGMALTLNGIAQGYVTDRVAALLRDRGVGDVMVELGEIAALGAPPGAAAWPVRLTDGTPVPLSDRALASSAPRGTCFDQAGRVGHILDPRSGTPATTGWTLVSVSAPQAAVADALSTAGCLMEGRDRLAVACARFAGARVERMA